MRPTFLAVIAASLIGAPASGHAQASPAPSAPPPIASPAPAAPPPSPAPSASSPTPAPWDALPPVSWPEKPELHSGFAMNLGLGVAIPFGGATGAQGDSLSKSWTDQFPLLSLEIGGNVTPALFIGAYGAYGLGGGGKLITLCAPGAGVTCAADSYRVGLAVAYRFLLSETFRPWVGYGIGYEWQDASFTSAALGSRSVIDLRGWEFGHFKVGIDVQPTRAFGLGPFVDVSVGKYGHLHEYVGGVVSDAIPGTAVHGWVTIGVRATFGP